MLILAESMFSFVMSLFPNWTIQLHLNMLHNIFQKIDNFLELEDENEPSEDDKNS